MSNSSHYAPLAYHVMTPGPTQVRENVRLARSLPCTNPDIDEEFCEFYKETCDLLADYMHTDNRVYIMGGEGILGLEAACASLTEPGDRVLVIDNGIFGKGFADFATMYGGDVVSFVSDYHRPVSATALQEFLEKDSNFKYATLVHCDTPSGVLNDLTILCPLLKRYGILTVVDSVAGMFGEPIDVEKMEIDMLCGGSQKALSAPPGLTMVWVSDSAMKAMEERKKPIASFYGNILLFREYYKDKWFPYTMPISDIYGLRAAVDNLIADPDIVARHSCVAEATRSALVAGGLELYLEAGFANTVTVFRVPRGYTDRQILQGMKADYQVLISGCFDVLAGKVLRIGHMGENAYPDKVMEVLAALTGTLRKLGFPVACDMAKVFAETYQGN